MKKKKNANYGEFDEYVKKAIPIMPGSEGNAKNEAKSGEYKKRSRKASKIVMLIAASLTGVSIATVATAVYAYDALFPRYERPDYRLYPGLYDYEKVKDVLPRERVSFPSGDNMLAGYYYPCEGAQGLVVVVHGFHAGADDFLPWIEALVKGGYAVFSYDGTATFDSDGESGVGMCQPLRDLNSALTFLSKTKPYADLPVALMGHSLGGYAVASVLELHPEVRACICIAPVNDGSTLMVDKGHQYVGDVAYSTKPVLDVYQKILFGDYVEYNGVRGINSTDIPVLIAHGVDDEVITLGEQSILAHQAEIKNPNVAVYYGFGAQGSHVGILHSAEAEEYAKRIEGQIKLLEMEKGRELTVEEKISFYETVDHRLYSEVNGELLSLAFDTLEKGFR